MVLFQGAEGAGIGETTPPLPALPSGGEGLETARAPSPWLRPEALAPEKNRDKLVLFFYEIPNVTFKKGQYNLLISIKPCKYNRIRYVQFQS